MKILIYNYYDENFEDISQLLLNSNSSILFAVTVSDSLRILKENKINKAIFCFDNLEMKVFRKTTDLYPSTQFYLLTNETSLNATSNFHILPKNIEINSIKQIIETGE